MIAIGQKKVANLHKKKKIPSHRQRDHGKHENTGLRTSLLRLKRNSLWKSKPVTFMKIYKYFKTYTYIQHHMDQLHTLAAQKLNLLVQC